jgi:lipoprotein NlpD
VEDRAPSSAPSVTTPRPAEPKPAAPEPARAGFYTVKPGDTLIRIALDQGQSWRDLARWNGLDNPNLIEVGQVLRVAPPGASDVAATRPVAPIAAAESRPLEPARPDAKAPNTASAPAAASGPQPAPQPVPVVPPAEGEPAWAWPAAGAVTVPFDEARNIKGLSIAGKPGDPVLAAADGRVMYAGSGLRGYGNMIIVKHNDTYLTAYAHNQSLLVKEDQVVKRGQQIAEMGSTDADGVKLHFEIRRKGKPVDPARLLPARP